MASFFDYLQFQARSQPAYPAIIHPKGVVGYETLVRNSLAAACQLAAQGLKPDDIVLLRLANPELHCSVLIGAMLAGITTVSGGEAETTLADNLKIDATLTDIPFENNGKQRVISVTPAWLKPAQRNNPVTQFRAGGENIVRVICTSGTTGERKAIPFTEQQLLQRVWIQIAGLRPNTGQSRSYSAMNLTGGASFSNMMLIFMTGGTLLYGWMQMQIPNFVPLYAVDRMLMSTGHLIALLPRLRAKNINLPSLKSVVVGGSRVSPQLAERARAEICRNIICLYGSTEVGVVATAPAETIIRHPSAVGYVVPGVRVEAVDENGKVLGADEEGILRIQVPGSPGRYLNDAEASKAAFREGWFYPGDLGRISEDGLLFCVGRQSERLNAGGVKVAPHVVEDVVRTQQGVLDAAAFELVNELGSGEIAVAIVTDGTADRTAVRKYCVSHLGQRAPRHFMVVKNIPRNENGKIDRAALQQMAKNSLSRKAQGASENQVART